LKWQSAARPIVPGQVYASAPQPDREDRMKYALRRFAPAAIVVALTFGAHRVCADDFSENRSSSDNHYVVNRLVSDLPGAAVTDPNLKNPWGIAFSPAGGPFWIADAGTGLSTVYNGDGSIVPLVVTIPGPGGSPANFVAAPTGIIWNPGTNPATAFLVPNTTIPAVFIFATEDGTISAWAGGLNPSDKAVLAVDNSKTGPGAVYKGLAFGVNAGGAMLFATNFRAGTVDVFDHNYQPVTTDGGFRDRNIPSGYAPFGIEMIDGNLFVSYAKQDGKKEDDVPGSGHGFVNVFDTDGHLLMRFASHGKLNSPWGMTRASFDFGPFSGAILIGNFGDGRINVFKSTGEFVNQLNGKDGKPLVVDDLWKLTLGGGAKSTPDTLYFTAGINDEADGLFGTITPSK
jgi:uncharacterized protein (TIGR03118 family)